MLCVRAISPPCVSFLPSTAYRLSSCPCPFSPFLPSPLSRLPSIAECTPLLKEARTLTVPRRWPEIPMHPDVGGGSCTHLTMRVYQRVQRRICLRRTSFGPRTRPGDLSPEDPPIAPSMHGHPLDFPSLDNHRRITEILDCFPTEGQIICRISLQCHAVGIAGGWLSYAVQMVN